MWTTHPNRRVGGEPMSEQALSRKSYSRTPALELARTIARVLEREPMYVHEPTPEGPVFANLNVTINGRSFNIRVCDIAGGRGESF